MKNTFFSIILLVAVSGSYAQSTSFAAPFSDNMVLQRNSSVKIWGQESPDTPVAVTTSWNGQVYTTNSDNEGNWMVLVSTPEGSEKPYSVTLEGNKKKELRNVLIGEVWLCSGQSNMVRPLRSSPSAAEAIPNATDGNIRYLGVPIDAQLKEQNSFSASWQVCSPTSAPGFGAVAYYFGKVLRDSLKVPIGLIRSAYGASSVQAWTDRETLSQFDFVTIPDTLERQPQKTPTATYNVMIKPLIGFGIKGAIWYQGEANRGEPEVYEKVFPAMIKSWRDKWGLGDFPFYYVQIVPFKHFVDGPFWNVMKDIYYQVDHTGFIVTLDLKDCENIHPPEKKPIGDRLARWALAKDYGFDDIVPGGPICTKASRTGEKLILNFDFAESGLIPGSDGLTGFEIAGSDRVYFKADGKISKDNTLALWSKSVPAPKYARYAYGPCDEINASLFNGAGLPASAFEITIIE